MELEFSGIYLELNTTITQSGGPIRYTVVSRPTLESIFPVQTSTFSRNDDGGFSYTTQSEISFATIQWKGFSAHLKV